MSEHPPKADKSAMGAINRPLLLAGLIYPYCWPD